MRSFNIIFKKIIIIFIIGLISRIIINHIYDINVFKEYTNSVSLFYYTSMIYLTWFISNLPKVSMDVFNFYIIREAISCILSGNSFFEITGYSDIVNSNNDSKPKISNSFFAEKNRERRNGSGRSKGSSGKAKSPVVSAGVKGLYGNNIKAGRVDMTPAQKALYNIDDNKRDIKRTRHSNNNKITTSSPFSVAISSPFNPVGSTLDKMDTFTVGSRSIQVGLRQSDNHVNSNVSSASSGEHHYFVPGWAGDSLYSTPCPSPRDVTRSALYANAPNAPKMGNLSTPSTMTPLFDSPRHSTSSNQYVRQDNDQYQSSNRSSLQDQGRSPRENIEENHTYSWQFNAEVRARTQWLIQALNNRVFTHSKGFSSEEVIISGCGNNKVKLCFNFINDKYHRGVSKLDSIYVKYNELGRRKYYWYVWERKKGNFSSYNEFKKFWDNDYAVWRDMNNKFGWDIKTYVDELVRLRKPFKK